MTGQLGNIRQLLKVDVQRAKAELEKHVREIRMVPQIEGMRLSNHIWTGGSPRSYR